MTGALLPPNHIYEVGGKRLGSLLQKKITTLVHILSSTESSTVYHIIKEPLSQRVWVEGDFSMPSGWWLLECGADMLWRISIISTDGERYLVTEGHHWTT
jgi:hypothetical protein